MNVRLGQRKIIHGDGWSIDKPADLPQTFRHDILATNFDEAKKTF